LAKVALGQGSLRRFNRASPVTGPTFVDANHRGNVCAAVRDCGSVATSTFKAETYRFLRQPSAPEEITAVLRFPCGTVHLPTGQNSEMAQS